MNDKILSIWNKVLDKTIENFPNIANRYIFIFDNTGKIIHISQGLQNDLKLTDISNLYIFDIIDITNDNDIYKILKDVLSGNTSVTFIGNNNKKIKVRAFTEKGNIANVNVYLCFAVPIMDIEPSNFYSSEVIVHDLEKISDITRNGIIVWDKDEEFFSINNHFYYLLGCEPLEFKPNYENLKKKIHKDYAGLIEKKLQNLWNDKQPYVDEEILMRHKSDEYFWVQLRARVAEWDKNQVPTKLLIIFSDIVKFKRRETELIQQIEKFERLSDFPYAGTFIININNIILDVNEEILKFTDYEKSKLIGADFFDFFPAEYHAIISEQIKNQNFIPIEIKIIKCDNSLAKIEFSISKYLFEGQITYYVSIRPVTDRIKHEMELLEAKLKAEENSKLKTAFLSNMSHEIRTPINGILGFLDLLKTPSLSNSERNEYIDIINNRSLMLLKIIDDIVDLSKIEAGQMKLALEEFDLIKLLNSTYKVFNKLKTSMGKKSIELRLSLPESVKSENIIADPIRLQQINANLINNALKFTHNGYIEFGYNVKSSDYLEFFVNDTGIGIPKNELEHIFERFWQFENTTRKKYKGSGLGLPISKGLIDLMGGKIQVDSEYHKGTTFKFTIPYKKSQKKSQKPTNNIEEEIKFEWLGKNILLVEDDEINMKYLQLLLKPTKANILSANNGQQAIDICNDNNDINIILMDIQLPVIDGFEALAEIKKINKNIPIIAQTGFALNEEKEKCLQAGFNNYITKPINKNLLFDIINNEFEESDKS